jgi:glycosyltransferase involved in cell wall biosynthesis
MMTPFLTVLITTYNYGRFIEQAIDSVLSQDFPLERVQIMVVDDGSADDTADRVKKYCHRIEYFYKPNGGQASALNFGIARARGEIIALLDADDYYLPGKLGRIAAAFQNDPALGMVYHRLQEWNMQTDERYEARSSFVPLSGDVGSVPDFFLQYVPQATSCISYRRSLLEPFLPIPESIRMLADGYLTMLIPFLSPVLAVREFLAVYRIHGNNCYYADDGKMPLEVRKSRVLKWQVLMDGMHKWLADNGYTRKQLPVRNFLDRFTLYMESEEFLVKSPGRVRFFRHLQTYNSCFAPRMSKRLRIINYFNALGALALGYEHFYLLDKWRENSISSLLRVFRRTRSGNAGK